jgi:hypothetical protein
MVPEKGVLVKVLVVFLPFIPAQATAVLNRQKTAVLIECVVLFYAILSSASFLLLLLLLLFLYVPKQQRLHFILSSV